MAPLCAIKSLNSANLLLILKIKEKARYHRAILQKDVDIVAYSKDHHGTSTCKSDPRFPPRI